MKRAITIGLVLGLATQALAAHIREYCAKVFGNSYPLQATCIQQKTEAKKRPGY